MHIRGSLWFGAVLLVPALAGAQEPLCFHIKGYGVHSGNDVVYHYRVINNCPTNISNPAQAVIVEIGRVDFDHEPELTGMPPAGYPPMYDDGVLDMTAPTGWEGLVSGEQEHVRHTLRWETTESASAFTLLPGQTLMGLSVTRRNVNATYLDSHFNIITDDSRKFSGIVEREDTVPPTLTVTVSPTRLQVTAGKLVTVNATVTSKDDYDPQPEIKLESITANEPLAAGDISGAALGTDDRQFQLRDVKVPRGTAGRLYTITYSVTDASGNKATASATVSVK
jgi:hypothetical protein